MPPLNPNNTSRVKIIYQNAQAEHAMIIRETTGASPGAGQAAFSAIIDNFGADFALSTVTAVQRADAGSDIFLDVAGDPLINSSFGSGGATVETNATFANFVGRSSTGRRMKLYLFGYSQSVSGFRLDTTESSDLGNAIDALNALTESPAAIDGNLVTLKPYVNIKSNDHWVHQSR